MGSYGRTVAAIEAMDITEAEKRMIFRDNVVKLLKLDA
jgi:predicted TIM-barrel fold metal-dependent hydrolase